MVRRRTSPPVRGRTTRALALAALTRIERGAYAHRVLPTMLQHSSLHPRERAQVTNWVYGTTRMRARIDPLIAANSKRKLKKLDPDIRAALRLGTFDLLQGGKPYVVVNELCHHIRPEARGYVNATLRKISTTPFRSDFGDSDDDWAEELSYPKWIVQRMRVEFGEVAGRMVLQSGNLPGLVTLRCKPGSMAHVQQFLKGVVRNAPKFAKQAIVIEGLGWPRVRQVIEQGHVTVQDQSSQLVVRELAPRPGERILEVGAAPGGKSTAIAEWIGADGLVVAVDVHAGRVNAIRTASKRLKLANVAPVVADGNALPFRPGAFDRVLLDAPCSGLGVLRRRPDARWNIQPSDIPELAAKQRQLLISAAPQVRPGGVLLYSVCTVTREETVGVEADVSAYLSEYRAEPIEGDPWRPRGTGGLIIPIRKDLDGMYVQRWRRSDPFGEAEEEELESFEDADDAEGLDYQASAHDVPLSS